MKKTLLIFAASLLIALLCFLQTSAFRAEEKGTKILYAPLEHSIENNEDPLVHSSREESLHQ